MSETALERARRWMTDLENGIETHEIEDVVAVMLDHLEAQASAATPSQESIDWLKERYMEMSKDIVTLDRMAHSLPAATPQPNFKTSSAPMDGTAAMPWLSSTVNREVIRRLIQEVITDSFKSTPFMGTESEVMWVGLSTLQLTLRWPTPSTSTPEAGDRGPVVRSG